MRPRVQALDPLPDPGDGYYRHVPMVVRCRDRMAMPLSLAMLTVAHPDRTTRLDRMAFAFTSCQAWTAGLYTAHRRMAAWRLASIATRW